MTATVEAGIPLWRLNDELAKRGLALSNLGDIDRQTIAGATSTGTHGTGLRYGSIAAAIVGMEIVTADGDVVRCSATEEPEIFACARVGLGVLGVVTQVTLQCEPLFKLRAIEIPIPWERIPGRVGRLSSTRTTTSTATGSRTPTRARSRRATAPRTRSAPGADTRSGRARSTTATSATAPTRRTDGSDPTRSRRLARDTVATFHRTERVDLSYNVFCTTRLVRFVEMEYAIPRADMARGLRAIRELIEREGLLVDFPIEIRGIGPDDIPLSMGSGRETCYLAVHLSKGTPFERYFHGVEAIMDGLGGRPHWGKMHFQTAATLGAALPGVGPVPSRASRARSGRPIRR